MRRFYWQQNLFRGGRTNGFYARSLSFRWRKTNNCTHIHHKKRVLIVPTLKEGAGVVTTRAHVHYVVTEYGVANLYGKTIEERNKELIRIAHPDHREALEKAAYEIWE